MNLFIFFVFCQHLSETSYFSVGGVYIQFECVEYDNFLLPKYNVCLMYVPIFVYLTDSIENDTYLWSRFEYMWRTLTILSFFSSNKPLGKLWSHPVRCFFMTWWIFMHIRFKRKAFRNYNKFRTIAFLFIFQMDTLFSWSF